MTIKRILVFRLSSLGDVALTVPVISTVLAQNKNIHLTIVCPAFMHALYPTHERLSFIDFDKKNKHKGFLGLLSFYKSLDISSFDAIADLHNVLRTKVLTSLAGMQMKKVARINKDRQMRKALVQGKIHKPLKHTTEKYADVFRSLGIQVKLYFELTDFHHNKSITRNGIGVAPFAKHKGKRFPLEKMKKVVEQLSQQHKIFIFGHNTELETIQDWEAQRNIIMCANLTIKEELTLMSSLKLMISMDSANMHLASLVGLPVISLWGVTHPYAGFLGYGQSMDWVVQDENCDWRPSSIYGNIEGPKENPDGFAHVLVSDVMNKVNQLLNNRYE